jgi:hypothetical protein
MQTYGHFNGLRAEHPRVHRRISSFLGDIDWIRGYRATISFSGHPLLEDIVWKLAAPTNALIFNGVALFDAGKRIVIDSSGRGIEEWPDPA